MSSAVDIWLFFLPAMLANLHLYLSAHIFGAESILPMDLNAELGGKRLVGDGRGLTSLPRAFFIGLLCGAVQGRLEEAALLALGAQFGMVCNSLLKRRLGLKQGDLFRPWDHIDFVLGAWLFYALQYSAEFSLLLWGIVYCGLAHLVLGTVIRSLVESRSQ